MDKSGGIQNQVSVLTLPVPQPESRIQISLKDPQICVTVSSSRCIKPDPRRRTGTTASQKAGIRVEGGLMNNL